MREEATVLKLADNPPTSPRTLWATVEVLVTGTFNVARPIGSPAPGCTVMVPICSPESTVIGVTSVSSYTLSPAM